MAPKATDKAALEAIFSDVAQARSLLSIEDSQFNRRVLIRTVFSGVEALANWMKNLSLEEYSVGVRRFSAAQLAVLRDESYYLDSSGVARAQPRFSALDANFRFAIDLHLNRPQSGLALDADWNGPGWQNIKKGMKVRNRLTHPRLPGDLVVSEEEVAAVISGYQFVIDLFLNHLIKAIERKGGTPESTN